MPSSRPEGWFRRHGFAMVRQRRPSMPPPPPDASGRAIGSISTCVMASSIFRPSRTPSATPSRRDSAPRRQTGIGHRRDGPGERAGKLPAEAGMSFGLRQCGVLRPPAGDGALRHARSMPAAPTQPDNSDDFGRKALACMESGCEFGDGFPRISPYRRLRPAVHVKRINSHRGLQPPLVFQNKQKGRRFRTALRVSLFDWIRNPCRPCHPCRPCRRRPCRRLFRAWALRRWSLRW